VVAGVLTYVARRLSRRLSPTLLSELKYPAIDPSRVLILRSAGDEATAALGATHIISWISGRIWLTTSRAVGTAMNTVEWWRQMLIGRWRVTGAMALICISALAYAAMSFPALPLPDEVIIVTASWLLLNFAIVVRGDLIISFLGAFLLASIAAPFVIVIALFGI